MSGGAVEAVRADREALLEICGGLADAEWKSESGCAGWSVQDVVAHMGTLFWLVVDPSTLPDTTGLPTEQAQDANVEARRSWSADRVLDDYRSVSSRALDVLAPLESQDFELPLGDLGTYPAALVPNAYSFDHYTHIRADLFAPRGPLTSAPPPSDELRLVPAIDWIVAALPQQNQKGFESLTGSIVIDLTGAGARTITLGSGDTMATIESDAAAFIRWVTRRGTWESLGVTATGDETLLALVREFRVF